MRTQIKLDFKQNLWSSFTVVIFLTFFLLLMVNFFDKLGTTPSYINEIQDAYDQTSVKVQDEIKKLQQDKHPDLSTKAILEQDQEQYEYLSAIIMAYLGRKPTEVNQALLAYAKYNLKETQQGRSIRFAWLTLRANKRIIRY